MRPAVQRCLQFNESAVQWGLQFNEVLSQKRFSLALFVQRGDTRTRFGFQSTHETSPVLCQNSLAIVLGVGSGIGIENRGKQCLFRLIHTSANSAALRDTYKKRATRRTTYNQRTKFVTNYRNSHETHYCNPFRMFLRVINSLGGGTPQSGFHSRWRSRLERYHVVWHDQFLRNSEYWATSEARHLV